MDFIQLEYFQTVAELENMSAASQKLFISQSTISRAISDLEKEMTVPLFERQGRKLRLNENGKIFLAYVDKIMNCLHEAEDKIATQKSMRHTDIRITAKITAEFLAQVHYLFLQLNPGTQLTIRNEPFSETNAFNSDFVLYPSPVPIDDDNNRTLFSDSICAALPAAHPLADKKELTMQDLSSEGMVLLPRNERFRSILDSYFRKENIDPVVKVECDNYLAILPMVEANAGISLVPEKSWGILSNYHIRLREDLHPPLLYYVIFGWKPDEQLSSEAQSYRDYLLSYFTPLPDTSAK